jgi:hypothetical protein
MTKLINSEEAVINEVISIIEESKKKVASYVNTTLLITYWNIGKLIVEYQGDNERTKYGDRLIERLSIELISRYGSGFTKSNLKRMRQFYEYFPISHSLSDQLSWTHYKHIITVKNLLTRDYYINEAVSRQLSVRELERLSIELTNRYGKGFDIRKLNRMKLFYSLFPIWETVSPKLGWLHYMLIITIKNIQARDY